MSKTWDRMAEAEREEAWLDAEEEIERWEEAERDRLDAIPSPFAARYGVREEFAAPSAIGARAEREG